MMFKQKYYTKTDDVHVAVPVVRIIFCLSIIDKLLSISFYF